MAQTAPRFNARQRPLNTIVSFEWQTSPIRDALDRLAATQHVAIWLDRRIDPESTLSFRAQQESIDKALSRLGTAHGWEATRLGHVLYVGPAPTARALRTIEFLLEQQVRQRPAPIRAAWLREEPVTWPALSEPRTLVAEWLATSQLRAVNLDSIPHDLWRAESFDKLSLLQRIILVLAGFELAPEIDEAGNLRVVPLPVGLTITKTYRLSNAHLKHLDPLKNQFSPDQLQQAGRAVQLTGRLEDHEQLQAWMQNPTSPDGERAVTDSSTREVDRSRQRYTLTVENQPRESILAAVAKQAQLRIIWQPPTDAMQRARVSVSVQNATLEQLLDAVLGDDAHYQVDGDQLRISSVPNPR